MCEVRDPVCAHAVLCFKCNQPGHLARDCPSGQVSAQLLAPVCLRCGRPDCPAAQAGDYVRCHPCSGFGQCFAVDLLPVELSRRILAAGLRNVVLQRYGTCSCQHSGSLALKRGGGIYRAVSVNSILAQSPNISCCSQSRLPLSVRPYNYADDRC